MEQDASAFAAAVEEATDTVPTQAIQQLKGRFRFLWGMYKAHSEVCFRCTAALPYQESPISFVCNLVLH